MTRPGTSWWKLCPLVLLAGGCGDGDDSLPAEQITTRPVDDDDDDNSGDDNGASEGTDSQTTAATGGGTDTQPPETSDTTPSGEPDSETDDAPSSTSAGPSTATETTGPSVDPCGGETHSIIGDGFVTASSEFDTLFGPIYEAELGVDGDIATSWFSEGPNVDGTESTFEWYTQNNRCIDRIVLRSNGAHANPDFHMGFGFGHVRIDVLDTSGTTVFSEDVDLDGSPDPDIDLDPEGVLGNQVLLSLSGHESEDCGGFSELSISGREEQ